MSYKDLTSKRSHGYEWCSSFPSALIKEYEYGQLNLTETILNRSQPLSFLSFFIFFELIKVAQQFGLL